MQNVELYYPHENCCYYFIFMYLAYFSHINDRHFGIFKEIYSKHNGKHTYTFVDFNVYLEVYHAFSILIHSPDLLNVPYVGEYNCSINIIN